MQKNYNQAWLPDNMSDSERDWANRYGSWPTSHIFLHRVTVKSAILRLTKNCHINSMNTQTHTRLTALCLGLPGSAGSRTVKPIWILLKQETVASAGPYASLHLAPDRQPRQHPTTQFFTGRMPFLPPNRQRRSNEGTSINSKNTKQNKSATSRSCRAVQTLFRVPEM